MVFPERVLLQLGLIPGLYQDWCDFTNCSTSCPYLASF